jgi:branched-chain amino acid transport system permease protein
MAGNDLLRRISALVIGAIALVGQVLANPFGHELIAEAAIFAIFAMSLDLLAVSGLISFGHAGFLGIGAYAYGGLTVLLGWPPGPAVVAAVLVGAAIAAVVGLFVLRTSGVFFIMVTLAVSLMFYAWAFRNPTFNGADGMGGIARLQLSALGIDLDDPAAFSGLTIMLCAAVWIGLEIVLGSPFGRTLSAIRQNPNRVRALGGRVFGCRLAAYVVSGAIAAFAGTLTAQHANFISPDIGNWFVSGDALIAIVIGGIGTLTGPLLGATLLVVLKEVLSSHVGHWMLWLGMVFIGVAMFMPKGIIGALMQWQDRRAAIGTRRDDPNSAGNL